MLLTTKKILLMLCLPKEYLPQRKRMEGLRVGLQSKIKPSRLAREGKAAQVSGQAHSLRCEVEKNASFRPLVCRDVILLANLIQSRCCSNSCLHHASLLHRRCCATYFACITSSHLSTNLLGPFHGLKNEAEIRRDLSNLTFLSRGRAGLEFQAVSALNEYVTGSPFTLQGVRRRRIWSQSHPL